MVVAVWSVKGGVGVTSVAALLAMGQVERAEDTLLIDLCGDVPLVLGCDDALVAPGIAEWTAMAEPTAAALTRIEIQARPFLHYVARGEGPIVDLARWLPRLSGARQVIIDCGVVTDPDSDAGKVVAVADHSVLVARECYLTLRAVQASTLTPTSVVVLKEPARHLGRVDVESAAQAPVVAEIAIDRAIASAIDSGLVRARLPRRVLRSMGKVVEHAA